MACLICGEEGTVRSHIIPRGLFRITKGALPKVIRTRRRDNGWDESQSGFFDDRILCAKHEARLGRYDDYAIRFCRAFKEQADDGMSVVTVPNPRPELLVGFACAVVWRMAASRSDLNPAQTLGAFAKRLADLLFDDVPFDPLLLLSRNAFHVRGKPLEMNVLPVPYRELDRRFWRFIACGIKFDLKLDARPAPAPMAVLAANTQSEVTLFEDFPQDALRTPGLAESLIAMTLPRRPFQRK